MYTTFNARMVGLTLPAAATLDLAASAGFEGVDFLVRDLLEAGDDPRELRARREDLGLRGCAFPMPVQWRAGASQFAADLAGLPRIAEAAAILGLSRTNTWVMPETAELPTDPSDRERHREDTVRLHVERIGAIARVLDQFDIRLGLEVIGVNSSRSGRGLPFISRMADLDQVLKPIQAESPNVGIVLDGWHLYAADESVEAGLAWGVPHVIVVHVADLPATAPSDRFAMNDGDRGLPGENGAIDSKALLQRLHGAGYEGSVTAEPMPACRTLQGLSPELVAERVASAIRSVWP